MGKVAINKAKWDIGDVEGDVDENIVGFLGVDGGLKSIEVK